MPPLKYWAFWDIHENFVFLGQTPYTLKISFFRVAQMQKWMAPVERARNTGQENGMICYVWMCGSRDIQVWKSGKTADSALSADFADFQTGIYRELRIQT